MNKELIAKQKKLLGLFFGMWALLLFNGFVFDLLDELGLYTDSLHPYGIDDGFILISLFAFTIFQMWAIYKYILKK